MSAGYRALALLALALGLIGGGYRWGSTANEARWQARQAKAVSQAYENFRLEERRGYKASESYQTEQTALVGKYQQLEKAFDEYRNRKAPLTRNRALPATPSASSDAQAPGCVVVTPESDPVLTHGGVWMWNSALTGEDAPSGACGLADQSDEACAVEAGLSLDDAWDNHTTNAKACAADRLRHQRLIDFINKGPQQR